MNKIFRILQNSLISASPYLAMLCGALLFSPICDWIINTHKVSRGNARKIFNTIGKYTTFVTTQSIQKSLFTYLIYLGITLYIIYLVVVVCTAFDVR